MDTTKKATTPSSVRLIGWLFIIAAGMMIISAGMGLAAWVFIKQVARGPLEFPQGGFGPFGGPASLFRYFGLLASLQIGLAVFMIYVSVRFIKLRAWARATLEVFAWIGLTFGLGFGIQWAFVWLDLTTDLPQDLPGPFRHFRYFGLAIGVFGILFWMVPTAVIIKFLRGKTIREAMVSAAHPPQSSDEKDSGGGQT